MSAQRGRGYGPTVCLNTADERLGLGLGLGLELGFGLGLALDRA